MRFKQKPHNLLLLTGIILFIVGLFGLNSAMDIHIDDTYFVFSLTCYVWIPAILLFMFWFLYLGTKNILYSKALTWVHIMLTIAGCIFMLTLPYLLTSKYEGLAGMPRHYYDIGQSKTYHFFGKLTTTVVVIGFILAIGQLTYLVNLVIGFTKRVGGQNNR